MDFFGKDYRVTKLYKWNYTVFLLAKLRDLGSRFSIFITTTVCATEAILLTQ